MAVLPIEMLGSDLLRRPAQEVVEIDETLRLLVQDMFETMYRAEGIGLAGPQVGVSQRLFVCDLQDGETPRFALINPRVVESSKATDRAEEGCLSIPGIAGPVTRPARVTVEAVNEAGSPVRLEAEGLLARCIQHEIDHLDGILFVDRLSPLKRDMLLKKYRAGMAEERKRSEARPKI
jgi:peptide deformylase